QFATLQKTCDEEILNFKNAHEKLPEEQKELRDLFSYHAQRFIDRLQAIKNAIENTDIKSIKAQEFSPEALKCLASLKINAKIFTNKKGSFLQKYVKNELIELINRVVQEQSKDKFLPEFNAIVQ